MKYELASSSWDKKEIEALNKVIASGKFTMGQNVKKFEKLFASYFGSKYGVMVNSGSSANLLAIASLFFRSNESLKPGDEILVPGVSWATTYHPLQQYGLKLKFVDIDIDTLNFDLNHLEKSITNSTKAILAVNLLGNPNNFLKIRKLIHEKNIILIEDNCESMGAKFEKKFSGSYGLLGTFSSFFSHHISTMEGGMIITDDLEIYHILLSLRAHGWTRDLPNINTLIKKGKNQFKESFRFILPGYNLRPLELSGAVGIEQLKKLPSIIKTRRSNALYFTKKFKTQHNFKIQKELGESSWFGFSLIIRNKKIIRDELLNYLVDKKIEVRPIVSGNFLKNDVLKYFTLSPNQSDLPNSDFLDKNGFFVGNHHYDITSKIDYLYNTIQRFLDFKKINT